MADGTRNTWIQATLLAGLVHVIESRARGGSNKCDLVDWTAPETRYVHPGNTWVNFMLYITFGAIMFAMLMYILFIQIMFYQRRLVKEHAILLQDMKERSTSCKSEDALTTREVHIN